MVDLPVLFGGDDASDRFPGIEDVMYFALDDDGKLLDPVGTYTHDRFDFDVPNEAEWLSWGDKAEDQELAYDLFECLQPV